MISDEIERIRSVENEAKRKISEAEIKSKEKVEIAKKKIIEEIEEKKKKLIEEIERWKKSAEAQAKIEADKIINDYKKRSDEIRRTNDEKIGKVARDVLKDIIG